MLSLVELVLAALFCSIATHIHLVPSTEAAANDHLRDFNVLCQLVRLGEAPIMTMKYQEKEQEAKDVVDRLDRLVELTSGNESMAKKILAETPDEKLRKLGLPPNGLGLRQTHRNLRVLQEKAKVYFFELTQAVKQGNQSFFDAQRNLAKVFFGETEGVYKNGKDIWLNGQTSAEATVLTQEKSSNKILAATAAEGCGGQNGGTQVGQTLINDVYCLCVGEKGDDGTCAKDIKKSTESSGTWKKMDGGSGATNLEVERGWPAIVGHCPKSTPKAMLIEEITARLAAFRGRLGMGTGSNAHAAAHVTLGKVNVYSNGCGGTTYLCVNYKTQLLGNSAQGIPWVNAYEEVIQKLRTMEEANQGIRRDLGELNQLTAEAWNIYEFLFSEPEGLDGGDRLPLAETSNSKNSTIEGVKSKTSISSETLANVASFGGVSSIMVLLVQLAS